MLLIQPLSLHWKMIINNKMNIYPAPAGRSIRRTKDTVVTTSHGLLSRITLTVDDFGRLTMIHGRQGHVNDNIINAFLQTLDQAVRKAAPHPARPPRHVFLSTYAIDTLKNAANGSADAFKLLQKILGKHGVNSSNLTKVENICFPVYILERSHWVLAI